MSSRHLRLSTLAANAPSVGSIISIFILLAYLSFRQRSTDVPYDTIIVNKDKPRISFGSYLRNVFSDEQGRRLLLTFLDAAQMMILVGLLVLGAVFGEQYGGKMATDTIHGVASVENPNITIQQRVILTFNRAANPSAMLTNANRLGRLTMVWASGHAISVTATSNRPIGNGSVVRTWTVPLGDVAQIDRVRTFSSGPAKPVSKADARWFWPLIFVVFLTAIALATYGDYLRSRDAWASLEPLNENNPRAGEIPSAVAERASSALLHGKDLRVVQYAGREKEVFVVRNSAFPAGHRFASTFAYNNPLSALIGEFRKSARQKRRADRKKRINAKRKRETPNVGRHPTIGEA